MQTPKSRPACLPEARSKAGMTTSSIVPGSTVSYAPNGSPDTRCYRVDCSKLTSVFPDLKPRWTLRDGIRQLYAAYQRQGMTSNDLLGSRYQRIKHIQKLQAEGRLDASLCWTDTRRLVEQCMEVRA